MGTGAGAAVGIVTELVDVHATLGGSITAFDIVRNGGWGRLGRLLKGYSAGDTGIASKDRNCWKGAHQLLASSLVRLARESRKGRMRWKEHSLCDEKPQSNQNLAQKTLEALRLITALPQGFSKTCSNMLDRLAWHREAGCTSSDVPALTILTLGIGLSI